MRLLCSCSNMPVPIYLCQFTQICSVFFSYGSYNWSKNNSPLSYTSTSSNMCYNIEVINNINIEFIFIIINRTNYLTRNNAGILVLNRYPDSRFCPGCAEQAQNWFRNYLKIKSLQQANPGKLLRNEVVLEIIICEKKLTWGTHVIRKIPRDYPF